MFLFLYMRSITLSDSFQFLIMTLCCSFIDTLRFFFLYLYIDSLICINLIYIFF